MCIRDRQSPASTVYTYRDLDGNGVDELILAFKPGKLFKEHGPAIGET